jgi:hypothetical protein
MKRMLITVCLLAAPMVSGAVPISDNWGSVEVEYWGRRDTCMGDCSHLPDVLYGRVVIDLELAPWDPNPDESLGHYGRPRGGFLDPGGFVTALEQSLIGGRSADLVTVSDWSPAHFNPEIYSVQNQEFVTLDGEIVAEQRLEFSMVAPRDWGIEGDSLAQRFDVRTEDIGGDASGIFQELINGVSRGYFFLIDRMRATPKVCQP